MKTDSAERCLLIGNFLFHIRYSVTTDQKPLGIDSVWRTGKKCYKIFSFFYCKRGSFFRFYYGNLVDFIT